MRGHEKGNIDTAERGEILPLSPKGKKIHKADHKIIHYGKWQNVLENFHFTFTLRLKKTLTLNKAGGLFVFTAICFCIFLLSVRHWAYCNRCIN